MAENPGTVWDRLLESAQQRASTITSPRRSGLVPLKLLDQPEVRHRPHLLRSLDRIDRDLRQVMRACLAGESPWPLFLHGPAGGGKTCAALCLLDCAGGLYYGVPELCQVLVDSQQGRLWNEAETMHLYPLAFWRKIGEASLLVLDEIGARQLVSDHHYDAVKRCLDEREGKPAIYISNLNLASVAGLYDDRIASRLAAGSIVELAGADRRIDP